MHHFLHSKRRRASSKNNLAFAYEMMEPRKVLAAYFPTYIDGIFTLGNGPEADSPYDLEDTFELSSLPDATKTIYVDNTGHHSVDNGWGHNIMFDPFDTDGDVDNFSDDELLEIQLQFQNLAEDFLPFGVNITTKEPTLDQLTKDGRDDEVYGLRVVNTQPTDEFGGFCGIAQFNIFDSDIDAPVFTVCKGDADGALVTAHEVGHALGLRHDGLDGAQYHPGTFDGDYSWGPIMGAPFGAEVTQWSDGDYAGSTNTEPDYDIITSDANGFGFRADDYGSVIADAHIVEANDDGEVFLWGIVERNTDVDVFEFSVGTGDFAITINPLQESANLDVRAKILDEAGEVLFESNSDSSMSAGFDLTLTGGTYYLTVEGTGRTGMYNGYGSIGLYTIEGVVNTVSGLPVGEAGRIENLRDEWVTIDFLKEYDDPVIVAGPASRNGADPVNVRIRNVTSDSFQIHIDEWDYRDGRHGRETVDYLVVEAGEYELDDGTRVMADNRYLQTQRWRTNSLSDTFVGGPTPILLAQTITENDPASVTTRLRYVAGTEFQLRLQEEQRTGDRGYHGPETVSWIAIQESVGTIGSQKYEAGIAGLVDHNAYSFAFENEFESKPVFLAHMQSHNGGDTAVVRYTELDQDGAEIYIEEERSMDLELIHNRESVGYVAIELGEILATDIARRPSSTNYTYDDIVGNLSRYRGNYPDYSEARAMVDARGADHSGYSFANDVHEHHDREIGHGHEFESDMNRLSAYFAEQQSISDSDNSDGVVNQTHMLTGESLASLSGSILSEVADSTFERSFEAAEASENLDEFFAQDTN